MAKNRTELEQLFITLLADDSKLEASLNRAIVLAKRTSEEISRAFEAGASRGFIDAGAKVEASARRQKAAIDPVKEALERVKNETASLRNTVEAGDTSNAEAIKRFEELRISALAQAGAFEVTSKEYRGFTQAAAMASRSIATLEGRTTRLGFSANNAIGVAAGLARGMTGFGGAANAAAKGLGIAQIALGGFAAQGPGLQGLLARLTTGFQQLAQVLPLIGAAAAGAALLGLNRLALAAADTADKIDKGAQQAGLSAEAYQELKFAFSQSGVEAEQFGLAMNTLTRRIGQAAQGQAGQARAFERIGVSIRDSLGQVRDTDAVLRDVANRLAGIASPAEQAAVAAALFGDRVGNRLLPALTQGAAGLDNLRERARELGLVISGPAVLSLVQYKDEMAALKQQFETARVEITAAFLPVLRNVLIPLIQNTVVPLFQAAAARVSDFAQKLVDTGPAGDAFRANLLANLAPVVSFGQTVVGVGLSVYGAFQTMIAGAAQLGAFLGTLLVEFERDAKNVGVAISNWANPFMLPQNIVRALTPAPGIADDAFARARAAGQETAQAYYEAALRSFELAGQAFTFDLEQLLADIARTTNEALTRGAGNLFGGDDASGGFGGDAGRSFLEGSLAALRSELAKAEQALAEAGTQGARDFQRAIIAGLQEAIAAIEAEVSKADPFAGARRWTERLGREFEFGLKNAVEVFDIVNPRAEELRAQIQGLLRDGDFDTSEIEVLLGKLRILEDLLKRLGVNPPRIQLTVDAEEALRQIEASMAALRTRFSDGIRATVAFVERTEGVFTSVGDAFVKLSRAGVTVTGPMLTYLEDRFRATAEQADRFRVALERARQSETTRLQNIQAQRFTGDAGLQFTIQAVERTQGAFENVSDAIRKFGREGVVVTSELLAQLVARFGDTTAAAGRLQQSLAAARQAEQDRLAATASVRYADGVLATIAAVQRTEGAFENLSDAIRKFGRVGVVVTGPVLEYLNQRFAETRDRAAELRAEFAAINNQRAAELTTVRFAGDAGVEFTLSLIERSQGAITSLSDAFQKFAREGVPVTGDVLRALTARFAENTAAADALQQRVLALRASLAAAESERGARVQTERFGDGIRATIAFVQQTEGAFEGVSDAVRKFGRAGVVVTGELLTALQDLFPATDDLRSRTLSLAEAYAELDSRTGEGVISWDDLRTAFESAAAAAQITREELERLLEVIGELEQLEGLEASMNELISNLDLATSVVDGLDAALSGITAEDLPGAIRGFTQIGETLGTIIGTAVGGPLVGLLTGQVVGAIGRFLQSVAKFGQNLFSPRLPDASVERARGVTPRGAPALELNFTFNQSLALASLTDPESRAALRGSALEAFEQFRRLLEVNVLPRLDRLEARA